MSAEPTVVEPEMIPYGMKAALVCLDPGPWREAARAYFASRGYYLIDEPDDPLAAARLKLNAVDAAVLGEGKAQALEELHARPGQRRRETALFLVGGFKSMDSWAAFAAGADWTLAEEDAARAGELLDETLARQEAQREPWRLAEAD